MKFGQLIKYNIRNIFFEKSYKKCSGETIPRAFSKKSKLKISQIKSVKFHAVVCQAEGYQHILRPKCRPLAFTSHKAFLKTKRGLELVTLPYFLYCF